MDINNILSGLEAKHPGEKEYLQAVKEVLICVEDVYNQHPEFEKSVPTRAASVSTHLSTSRS